MTSLGLDYLGTLADALGRWRREPTVRTFLARISPVGSPVGGPVGNSA